MKDYHRVNYYTKKKSTFDTLKLFHGYMQFLKQGAMNYLLYFAYAQLAIKLG
jgi:hypothetical protein